MSTFICSKCGCIDNSAKGGTYWTRDFGDKNKKPEPPICTECNGKKWHNAFPKEHWSECGTKAELIAESQINKGNYVNAVEYFKKETNGN